MVSQCPKRIYPEDTWSSFVLLFLCDVIVIICFVPLDAYVLIYAASAVRGSSLGTELWRNCCIAQFLAYADRAVSWTPDSCLILSLGVLAVWLSFLACAVSAVS